MKWADVNLSPLFRQNFKAMHTAMWAVRLRRIEADHFVSQPQSWWIDLGTAARLAGRFAQVYRGYKREKATRGAS